MIGLSTEFIREWKADMAHDQIIVTKAIVRFRLLRILYDILDRKCELARSQGDIR